MSIDVNPRRGQRDLLGDLPSPRLRIRSESIVVGQGQDTLANKVVHLAKALTYRILRMVEDAATAGDCEIVGEVIQIQR